ncbi:MAG: D-alanyl-D-alanine carboxypeptidase [Pseudomonadota bacterium]
MGGFSPAARAPATGAGDRGVGPAAAEFGPLRAGGRRPAQGAGAERRATVHDGVDDQGLREIDGNIVLDRDAFQLAPSDHAGTPLPSAGEPRHVWPDAMTLDEGLIRVVVRPARGPRAALSLQPVLSDVTLDNRVATGGGCSATPRWQAGRDGRATIVVLGHWGAACGTRSVSLVPQPDSGIAARALPGLWAAAGGVLRARVVSAPVVPGVSPMPLGPDGEALPALSFDRSKPLTELVRDINKLSDNVGARNLMLSLSPGFPARPATLAGAQKVVRLWLRDQGLADGDGHRSRMSRACRTANAPSRVHW